MSALFRKMGTIGMVLLLASCGLGGGRKLLNRRISLSRHDDIPYGTRVAYESLSHLFPDANITTMSNANPVPVGGTTGTNQVLIIVSSSVVADASDVTTLMNFIQQGNQVFISANRVSENLLKELSIRTTHERPFFEEPDSLTVGVYNPVNAGYQTFSYPGDSYDNYITRLDSQYTSILGRDKRGRPNFVRLSYKGGGAIYLQFAPLAFSNFFLLHKQNIAYYENAFSYLSANTREIIWDEYYRYDHTREFSAFQYILGNPALRWAFWLLLLLIAVIYLFDSKRRQREIPVIGALSNTSLDFVRTIGRLYFQRRDNHNLAMKMVAHFQDQVRTRFHLTVTTLDESFVDRLAYRTGYPKQTLTPLVGYMQELPSKAYISDDELLDFHQQLEAFYKHT
jgi:hypothetical protein